MTNLEFTIRVSAALLAGMIIGFERQWHHKSAGLRTTTLVSVGSAVYVLLSIIITQTNGDVTRIIGQVVTGIGFLCAGVIFREGLSIHGLTTAVTIWCSSAIGCLAAAGYYVETSISTFLILVVNLGLKPVDNWLVTRQQNKSEKSKES
ncbi:MAG TPA: MgtC/SapB family protein [Cyclobacteriaceae bacterium]|jgi:putative Mg2+ transporter-C (MgtC) family protein|nr:MgtC/SapB family protein [Cyclobacteriaceae bacterium]